MSQFKLLCVVSVWSLVSTSGTSEPADSDDELKAQIDELFTRRIVGSHRRSSNDTLRSRLRPLVSPKINFNVDCVPIWGLSDSESEEVSLFDYQQCRQESNLRIMKMRSKEGGLSRLECCYLLSIASFVIVMGSYGICHALK